MKNKHLVLLFLGVLALGGVVRWWPWRGAADFQARLLPIDVTTITRLRVLESGDLGILDLVRTDGQWVATYRDQSVVAPDSLVAPLLLVLNELAIERLLHTEHFTGPQGRTTAGTQVEVHSSNARPGPTNVYIGRMEEIQGVWHTWVAINDQRNSYAVAGDLNQRFRFDFRKLLAKAAFAGVVNVDFRQRFDLLTHRDTVQVVADSDSTWRLATAPDTLLNAATVNDWMGRVQALQYLLLDRDFDETRARETWLGRVVLHGAQDSLRLDFYWMRHAPLYDDPERHEQVRNFRPHVVVASSAQPRVFFAWGDSVAAARVLRFW